MTVSQLVDTLSLKVLNLAEEDREIENGYCGDLLSYVMGRAKSGDAWVTIMTNVNVVAVAALTDSACVILAEDSVPEEAVIQKAKQQGVNLLQSPLTAFELCGKIAAMLA